MKNVFEVGDLVKMKTKSGPNEMYIHEIVSRHIHNNQDNPMYLCKYFDEKENKFITEKIIGSVVSAP